MPPTLSPPPVLAADDCGDCDHDCLRPQDTPDGFYDAYQDRCFCCCEQTDKMIELDYRMGDYFRQRFHASQPQCWWHDDWETLIPKVETFIADKSPDDLEKWRDGNPHWLTLF